MTTSFPCQVCCGPFGEPYTECQPSGGCGGCGGPWQADFGSCLGADCSDLNAGKHLSTYGWGVVCQWIAANCHRIGNYPNCYCDMTLLGCYQVGWPCCSAAIHFYQWSSLCPASYSWGGCTYDRSGDRVMGGTGIHECEFSGPSH